MNSYQLTRWLEIASVLNKELSDLFIKMNRQETVCFIKEAIEEKVEKEGLLQKS